MKKYNFTINQFEDELIYINKLENKKNKNVRTIDFNKFVNQFYESRNFPFANLMLPKVVAYFSPVFEYENASYAFLITQMKPRKGQSSPENVIVFPWTFCISFVDLHNKKIVESLLFFSEGQFLSEELHKFYVPKIKDNFVSYDKRLTYSKSNFLEYICSYTGEVLKFNNTFAIYERNKFGEELDNIQNELIKIFYANKTDDINWLIEKEILNFSEEDIKYKLSTYYKDDDVVLMNKIDEFCLDKINNPPSFIDMIDKIWKESAE